MKSIGVLTYWGVPNYGAWVQAYALNKLLSDMYPNAEVRHINYLEESHWNYYYKSDPKGQNNFSYSWDSIPHTEKLNKTSLEGQAFDILVTGADSIWEEIVLGKLNPDWHLVGNDMPNCKKIISYAPSSGMFDATNIAPEEMKKGFLKYDAISVRDETTQELVESTIGKKPEVVLDPALLWDFSKDINVKKTTFEKYIAVYGGQWTETFVAKLKKMARDNNLLLISIGFINDWCDVNFLRNELRCFEWLGMIAGASYVATSTFHGLMMSLSYNKQVKFCQVDFVKNRSQTLLKQLDLVESVQNFEKNIDYARVNEKLTDQKNISKNWLLQNTK